MSDVSDVSTGGFDEAEETLSDAVSRETSKGSNSTGGQAFWGWILQSRNVMITIVGIVLFFYFSVATTRFLTTDSVFNMLRNLSYIGIVAVGVTYLFIAGELDLSVGSEFGFLTVVMGVLVARAHLDPWLGMILVIAFGVAIGAFNGLITTKFGIPSFIVTLAGLLAFRSGAILLSGPQPSTTEGVGLFYSVTGGYIGGVVPWLIVWMLVVMLVGGAVLALTRFGFHVYATGGNREASRNSGINTDRIKTLCFMITGGLCGLIAGLIFGYLHVAAPTTGTGFEFRVIGAVIVGGVALSGGRGSIYASLVGTIIIGIITTGLVLLGLSQYFGDVATGVLIAATGALDLYVRRAASRSLSSLEG